MNTEANSMKYLRMTVPRTTEGKQQAYARMERKGLIVTGIAEIVDPDTGEELYEIVGKNERLIVGDGVALAD